MDPIARYVRRNIITLGLDNVLFLIGFAFWDPTVIVPAFVKELTGSGLLIGVLSALRILMLTWPQFWVASLMTGSTRTKPLLLRATALGRAPVILLALAAFLWAGRAPWLVFGVLVLAVALFYTSEGFASVTWPHLVAKVIPAHVRGRFLGAAQLLGSLASLGGGALVRLVLGLTHIPVSSRWAVLFACAFGGFLLSWIGILACHEEPDANPPARVDLRQNLHNMWRYVTNDGRLRRIIGIQLLLGTAGAVSPFFVIRARELIAGGDALLGLFLIAQSLGGMVAALSCGYLIDRVGSWAAIRAITATQTLAIVAAILAGLLHAPQPLYLLAFFCVGFIQGSSWWSFISCLLEIATPEQRPAYLASSGILNSPTFISALLVGSLYGVWGAEPLFAVALLLSGAAIVLSLGMARVRPAPQEIVAQE